MIASLHDENKYYYSWFYDNVEELSLEERAEMAKPSLKKKYKKTLDLKDVYGEKRLCD
jgi:hypothetical protein